MPKDLDLLGKTVEVDIIDTGKHYLMGKVVHETLVNMPRLSPLSTDAVLRNKDKSVRKTVTVLEVIENYIIMSCLYYIIKVLFPLRSHFYHIILKRFNNDCFYQISPPSGNSRITSVIKRIYAMHFMVHVVFVVILLASYDLISHLSRQ